MNPSGTPKTEPTHPRVAAIEDVVAQARTRRVGTIDDSLRSGQDSSFLGILMGVTWMRGGHERPQGPRPGVELLSEGNAR